MQNFRNLSDDEMEILFGDVDPVQEGSPVGEPEMPSERPPVGQMDRNRGIGEQLGEEAMALLFSSAAEPLPRSPEPVETARAPRGAFDALFVAGENLELTEGPWKVDPWKVGDVHVPHLGAFVWNAPGAIIEGLGSLVNLLQPPDVGGQLGDLLTGKDEATWFTEEQKGLATLGVEALRWSYDVSTKNPYDPQQYEKFFSEKGREEQYPTLTAAAEEFEEGLPWTPWSGYQGTEVLARRLQEEGGEFLLDIALSPLGGAALGGARRVGRTARRLVDDVSMKGVGDFEGVDLLSGVDSLHRQQASTVELDLIRGGSLTQEGGVVGRGMGSVVEEGGRRFVSTAAHVVLGKKGDPLDFSGIRARTGTGEIGTVRGVSAIDYERDIALLEVSGLTESLDLPDMPLGDTPHTLLGREGVGGDIRLVGESGGMIETTTAVGVGGASGAPLVAEGDTLFGVYLGVQDSVDRTFGAYASGSAVRELFSDVGDRNIRLGREHSQRAIRENLQHRASRHEAGVQFQGRRPRVARDEPVDFGVSDVLFPIPSLALGFEQHSSSIDDIARKVEEDRAKRAEDREKELAADQAYAENLIAERALEAEDILDVGDLGGGRLNISESDPSQRKYGGWTVDVSRHEGQPQGAVERYDAYGGDLYGDVLRFFEEEAAAAPEPPVQTYFHEERRTRPVPGRGEEEFSFVYNPAEHFDSLFKRVAGDKSLFLRIGKRGEDVGNLITYDPAQQAEYAKWFQSERPEGEIFNFKEGTEFEQKGKLFPKLYRKGVMAQGAFPGLWLRLSEVEYFESVGKIPEGEMVLQVLTGRPSREIESLPIKSIESRAYDRFIFEPKVLLELNVPKRDPDLQEREVQVGQLEVGSSREAAAEPLFYFQESMELDENRRFGNFLTREKFDVATAFYEQYQRRLRRPNRWETQGDAQQRIEFLPEGSNIEGMKKEEATYLEYREKGVNRYRSRYSHLERLTEEEQKLLSEEGVLPEPIEGVSESDYYFEYEELAKEQEAFARDFTETFSDENRQGDIGEADPDTLEEGEDRVNFEWEDKTGDYAIPEEEMVDFNRSDEGDLITSQSWIEEHGAEDADLIAMEEEIGDLSYRKRDPDEAIGIVKLAQLYMENPGEEIPQIISESIFDKYIRPGLGQADEGQWDIRKRRSFLNAISEVPPNILEQVYKTYLKPIAEQRLAQRRDPKFAESIVREAQLVAKQSSSVPAHLRALGVKPGPSSEQWVDIYRHLKSQRQMIRNPLHRRFYDIAVEKASQQPWSEAGSVPSQVSHSPMRFYGTETIDWEGKAESLWESGQFHRYRDVFEPVRKEALGLYSQWQLDVGRDEVRRVEAPIRQSMAGPRQWEGETYEMLKAQREQLESPEYRRFYDEAIAAAEQAEAETLGSGANVFHSPMRFYGEAQRKGWEQRAAELFESEGIGRKYREFFEPVRQDALRRHAEWVGSHTRGEGRRLSPDVERTLALGLRKELLQWQDEVPPSFYADIESLWIASERALEQPEQAYLFEGYLLEPLLHYKSLLEPIRERYLAGQESIARSRDLSVGDRTHFKGPAPEEAVRVEEIPIDEDLTALEFRAEVYDEYLAAADRGEYPPRSRGPAKAVERWKTEDAETVYEWHARDAKIHDLIRESRRRWTAAYTEHKASPEVDVLPFVPSPDLQKFYDDYADTKTVEGLTARKRMRDFQAESGLGAYSPGAVAQAESSQALALMLERGISTRDPQRVVREREAALWEERSSEVGKRLVRAARAEAADRRRDQAFAFERGKDPDVIEARREESERKRIQDEKWAKTHKDQVEGDRRSRFSYARRRGEFEGLSEDEAYEAFREAEAVAAEDRSKRWRAEQREAGAERAAAVVEQQELEKAAFRKEHGIPEPGSEYSKELGRLASNVDAGTREMLDILVQEKWDEPRGRRVDPDLEELAEPSLGSVVEETDWDAWADAHAPEDIVLDKPSEWELREGSRRFEQHSLEDLPEGEGEVVSDAGWGQVARSFAADLGDEGALPEGWEDVADVFEPEPEVVEQPKIEMTASQTRALEHVMGPAVVRAGPGSGKSQTLVGRLDYLTEQGHAEPSDILTLVFGKEAEQSLQRRVSGSEKDWNISTIHSFALSVVRENFGELSYKQVPRISEGTFEGWLSAPGRAEQFGVHDDRVGNWADLYEKERLSFGTGKEDYSRLGEPLQAAIQEYRLEKFQKGTLDFTDAILQAGYLLEKNEALRESYADKFKFVQVDEFQDVSPSEARLIQNLGAVTESGDRNLWVVGDLDQGIMSFRGGEGDVMRGMLGETSAIYDIEENFRSTPEIVEAAQGFIEGNLDRVPMVQRSTRESGVPVSLLDVQSHLTQQEKLQEVANQVRLGEETAILARTHYERDVYKEEIPKILRHEGWDTSEISDLLSFETIHASKGLEYQNVILPLNLLESRQKKPMLSFPSPYAKDAVALAEEERLFYVGMTRAEERLVIMGDRYHPYYEDVEKVLAKEDYEAPISYVEPDPEPVPTAKGVVVTPENLPEAPDAPVENRTSFFQNLISMISGGGTAYTQRDPLARAGDIERRRTEAERRRQGRGFEQHSLSPFEIEDVWVDRPHQYSRLGVGANLVRGASEYVEERGWGDITATVSEMAKNTALINTAASLTVEAVRTGAGHDFNVGSLLHAGASSAVAGGLNLLDARLGALDVLPKGRTDLGELAGSVSDVPEDAGLHLRRIFRGAGAGTARWGKGSLLAELERYEFDDLSGMFGESGAEYLIEAGYQARRFGQKSHQTQRDLPETLLGVFSGDIPRATRYVYDRETRSVNVEQGRRWNLDRLLEKGSEHSGLLQSWLLRREELRQDPSKDILAPIFGPLQPEDAKPHVAYMLLPEARGIGRFWGRFHAEPPEHRQWIKNWNLEDIARGIGAERWAERIAEKKDFRRERKNLFEERRLSPELYQWQDPEHFFEVLSEDLGIEALGFETVGTERLGDPYSRFGRHFSRLPEKAKYPLIGAASGLGAKMLYKEIFGENEEEEPLVLEDPRSYSLSPRFPAVAAVQRTRPYRRLRAKAEELLDKTFGEETFHSEMMKSIVLGKKGNLSQETKDVFVKTGQIHALVQSGMHISLFSNLLSRYPAIGAPALWSMAQDMVSDREEKVVDASDSYWDKYKLSDDPWVPRWNPELPGSTEINILKEQGLLPQDYEMVVPDAPSWAWWDNQENYEKAERERGRLLATEKHAGFLKSQGLLPEDYDLSQHERKQVTLERGRPGAADVLPWAVYAMFGVVPESAYSYFRSEKSDVIETPAERSKEGYRIDGFEFDVKESPFPGFNPWLDPTPDGALDSEAIDTESVIDKELLAVLDYHGTERVERMLIADVDDLLTAVQERNKRKIDESSDEDKGSLKFDLPKLYEELGIDLSDGLSRKEASLLTDYSKKQRELEKNQATASQIKALERMYPDKDLEGLTRDAASALFDAYKPPKKMASAAQVKALERLYPDKFGGSETAESEMSPRISFEDVTFDDGITRDEARTLFDHYKKIQAVQGPPMASDSQVRALQRLYPEQFTGSVVEDTDDGFVMPIEQVTFDDGITQDEARSLFDYQEALRKSAGPPMASAAQVKALQRFYPDQFAGSVVEEREVTEERSILPIEQVTFDDGITQDEARSLFDYQKALEKSAGPPMASPAQVKALQRLFPDRFDRSVDTDSEIVIPIEQITFDDGITVAEARSLFDYHTASQKSAGPPMASASQVHTLHRLFPEKFQEGIVDDRPLVPLEQINLSDGVTREEARQAFRHVPEIPPPMATPRQVARLEMEFPHAFRHLGTAESYLERGESYGIVRSLEDIYDADTFTGLLFDAPTGMMYQEDTVRLGDFNAPEIKPDQMKPKEYQEREAARAREARDVFRSMVERFNVGRDVEGEGYVIPLELRRDPRFADGLERGYFGRVLGDINFEGVDYERFMVQQGMGSVYGADIEWGAEQINPQALWRRGPTFLEGFQSGAMDLGTQIPTAVATSLLEGDDPASAVTGTFGRIPGALKDLAIKKAQQTAVQATKDFVSEQILGTGTPSDLSFIQRYVGDFGGLGEQTSQFFSSGWGAALAPIAIAAGTAYIGEKSLDANYADVIESRQTQSDRFHENLENQRDSGQTQAATSAEGAFFRLMKRALKEVLSESGLGSMQDMSIQISRKLQESKNRGLTR